MRQQRTGLLVMAMMLMIVLARVFSGGSAQAADPDFTNVTDILNGWRQLLPTDDLALIRRTQVGAIGSLLLTDNSHITSTQPTSPISSPDPRSFGRPTVIGARMFELPYDVAVSAVDDPKTGQFHWSIDGSHGHLAAGMTPITADPANYGLLSATADFTGDGYDDIIFFLKQAPPPPYTPSSRVATLFQYTDPTAVVATARDTADPSKGLKFGKAFTFRVGVDNHIWPFALATGTIAGTLRVLGLGNVHPAPCDNRKLAVESYSVDPHSLAITSAGTFSLTLPEKSDDCVRAASIAAGRFGTTTHDQVAVAYSIGKGVKIITIALDDRGTPSQKAVFDTGAQSDYGYDTVWLRSGRFNWNSAFEQAALLIRPNVMGGPSVRILSFDQNLNVQSGPAAGLQNGDRYALDLEVGNFDHRKSNSTERDPNLQLAVLSVPSLINQNVNVQIFDVDPMHGFKVTGNNVSPISNGAGPGQWCSGNQCWQDARPLATVDLQGRSLELGAPIKVTVTGHLQPDLVLGIPPMHIDYIRDVDNLGPTGKPDVLNLTVMPDLPDATAFNTQFEFSSTASSRVSTSNTTSWGYSTGGSAGAKVTLGNPDATHLSVEVKAAGKETHEDNVADTYDTYAAVTTSLSATTGFADHLFFTASRHNVYYYPVIGEKICPAGNSSCTESQKESLFVQFSGVDLLEHHDTDATTQEWYQPINEPGNLFSYPWSLTQLQESIPNLAPLTTNPAPWRATDTSTSAYATTWIAGGTKSQTTGHVDTHSFDLSVAVTAQVGAEGIFTAGLSGEYD